jgi:MFS family permease
MLPLVFGMLGASVISGRLISKTGHYRKFPIFGTSLLVIGLWLFSHLTLTTSHVLLSLWMFVIGAGLGSFMQVAILAVQNSTDRADLGAATSTVTFFRSIGGSLGGAIFGSILVSRLTHHLQGSASSMSETSSAVTSGVANLPESVKQHVLSAYVTSFQEMFLYAIPFAVAAFIISLFLREQPLKGRETDPAHAEASAH